MSLMTMQRLLTRTEQASFMARHPVVATMVAETKTAIVLGQYDWNYYDNYNWELKFPGIIEPIGIQVQDNSYGLVTIQPARDGEIYFSGWSDHDLGTGKGHYESPPDPRGPLDDLSQLLTMGVAALTLIALLQARKKRG